MLEHGEVNLALNRVEPTKLTPDRWDKASIMMIQENDPVRQSPFYGSF